MPYPHQAEPDVAAARGRVRALVDDLLPGGVDEGTGGALDALIASWASGWLARIDSEHADHHAVIDRLVGGARQQLADAEAAHERDRRALEIARRDYADARDRLMEPSAPSAPSAEPDTGRHTGPAGLLRRVTGRGTGSAVDDVPPSPEPATAPLRVPPASYGTTMPSGAPGDRRGEDPATDQPLTRPGEPR
jgi:hypothetical protein